MKEGKVYLVKITYGSVWLFKKHIGICSDKITGCNSALCLDDMFKVNHDGYVCRDDEIMLIKPANENYIAIWNRAFNDNVELR